MRWARLGLLTLLLAFGASPEAQATLIGVQWERWDTQKGYYSPVYEIDESTGSGVTLDPGSGYYRRLNSLGLAPDGYLYSVDDARIQSGPSDGWLIRIDPFTGFAQATVALDLGATDPDVRGLAFDPAGVLYIVNDGLGSAGAPDSLYRVDLASGEGTFVGDTGFFGLTSLAISSTGAMYAWDVDSGLVTINASTGLAADVGDADDATLGAGIQGLAFVGDVLFGVRDALYRIDIEADSAPVLVGSGGYADVRGIALIPEPATWALLLLGLLGLATFGRARRTAR